MKWTVQQLQQARYETIQFDEIVQIEDRLTEHQDVRAASDIRLEGTVTAKRNVYTFKFKLSGDLTLACARTLADVAWPFLLEGTAHFVPEGEMPPSELDEEDLYTYSGEIIDLSHVIQEHVLVKIPLQVFADNPSDALAPPSGNGWELVTDEAKKKQVDPRLADLAKFFDKE
ncbi:YceD family protein [Shouchella patagoniensis]|uniref:YceD family protein n=1 Tax=Shouchella patagoniensis TaxID=228576 RepID=UPI0009952F2C|nr:YceD family protein [Shouchella patagoniensis]